MAGEIDKGIGACMNDEDVQLLIGCRALAGANLAVRDCERKLECLEQGKLVLLRKTRIAKAQRKLESMLGIRNDAVAEINDIKPGAGDRALAGITGRNAL